MNNNCHFSLPLENTPIEPKIDWPLFAIRYWLMVLATSQQVMAFPLLYIQK